MKKVKPMKPVKRWAILGKNGKITTSFDGEFYCVSANEFCDISPSKRCLENRLDCSIHDRIIRVEIREVGRGKE